MNLKSYIRGLGCGFILAGVILLVAFSASQNKSEKNDSKDNNKVVKNESVEAEKNSETDAAPAPETTVTPETTAAPETAAVPETTKAPETTAAPETTKAPETTQEQTTKQEETTTQPPAPAVADGQVVHILIPGGTGSYAAAKILKDAGLIDDLDAFDEFMIQGGYESKLVVGEYDIQKGSDFTTIARAITRK